jgi:hypothetical protein
MSTSLSFVLTHYSLLPTSFFRFVFMHINNNNVPSSFSGTFTYYAFTQYCLWNVPTESTSPEPERFFERREKVLYLIPLPPPPTPNT